jgi:transaldolase
MQFFLNSSDIAEIRTFQEDGLIHGVTTNPSLASLSPLPIFELIRSICAIVSGPVNVQVTALDSNAMIDQAKRLSQIAENVVIKLPMTYEGVVAATSLEREGIKVNLTLCFSVAQALYALNFNVSYLSVFSGRLSDMNQDGEGVLRDICALFRQYPNTNTQIIAATLNNLRVQSSRSRYSC